MSRQSRHQSVINRQSDSEYREDHWLKQFEDKLQKGAVQPRGESLFDQISSIMNSKGKYPSVQAAVDDMMHRSGLKDYLDKVKLSSAKEEIQASSVKTAYVPQPTPQPQPQPQPQSQSQLPKVIQQKPSILRTLNNIMNVTKGNMTVSAIIGRLRAIYEADISDKGAWDSEDLIRFVSRVNLQAKANNPSSYENFDNIGQSDHSTADSDIDPSNTDAFNALMPAKI